MSIPRMNNCLAYTYSSYSYSGIGPKEHALKLYPWPVWEEVHLHCYITNTSIALATRLQVSGYPNRQGGPVDLSGSLKRLLVLQVLTFCAVCHLVLMIQFHLDSTMVDREPGLQWLAGNVQDLLRVSVGTWKLLKKIKKKPRRLRLETIQESTIVIAALIDRVKTYWGYLYKRIIFDQQ